MVSLTITAKRSECRYACGLLIRDGNHRAIEVALRLFIGADRLNESSMYRLIIIAYREALKKHWKKIVLEPSTDGLYVKAAHPSDAESDRAYRLCYISILKQ